MKFIQESIKTILLVLIFLECGPLLWSAVKTDYKSYFTPHSKVGLLSFENPITRSIPFTNTLSKLFKDTSIKAILLKINCADTGPLGSSQEIAHTITTLKKEYPKPIITFAENFCFGNSYLIASTTDAIIATPGTLIGNISNTSNNLFNVYDQTDASQDNVLFAHQKESLAAATEDGYQQVITTIASARNLPLNQLTLWAQGAVFTGKQAVEKKMIDATGSLNDALILLKTLAPLEEEIIWVENTDSGFIALMTQHFFPQEDLNKPVLFE